MKKYENFCNALNNLKDIHLYEEPYDNVTITGLVGLYEICFEQAWKMMKEIYKKSDIMLFLPGGIGTFAEILSSIEESRTKDDGKLLILYNDDFFYTPLIKEMYSLFERGFAKRSIGEYCRIESIEEEIVKLVENEKNRKKDN